MMRTVLTTFVLFCAVCAAPLAIAQSGPNPDMGHCTDDPAVPPENVVSSCINYIDEAYKQSFGLQYVPAALFYEARARQQQGRLAEAKKLAARAVQMAPGYFRAWRMLVEMMMNLSGSEADAKAADAMIAAHPTSAGVLNAACWERATRGLPLETALAACNEAIRLDPKSADAYDSRCFTKMKMADYANAVADCDAALKLDPKLASSMYMRGTAEVKLDHTATGNADIASAKAIDAKIADTYAGYGVTP